MSDARTASRGFSGLKSWLLKQPVFTSKILPRLPRRVRWLLRTIYFGPLDLFESIKGTRDPMVPPHRMRFSGAAGQDFIKHGQRLVDALQAVAGLDPHTRVLDIGSGIGRLAVPLTGLLEAPGSYDGLDIVKSGVDWCQTRITPRYPIFQFTLADVANREYNPSGGVSAASYTLPYADGQFDLVVLFSVFTHMTPEDMENYVGEIARVLAPGGRCFATYMLMNAEVEASVRAGAAIYDYTHHVGNYWVLRDGMESPELNVAYDEDYVVNLFANNGMVLQNGIYHSAWSGLPDRADPGQPVISLGQDVVVATKA